MQKVGNIPYLCKHINQGTTSREYSLRALSLQIGVPHTELGVFECHDLAQARSMCNNLSLGRAKLAERLQHSRCVAHLLPKLTCISMVILVF